jgi:hypothetical protein
MHQNCGGGCACSRRLLALVAVAAAAWGEIYYLPIISLLHNSQYFG